jgi:hypothetical protein
MKKRSLLLFGLCASLSLSMPAFAQEEVGEDTPPDAAAADAPADDAAADAPDAADAPPEGDAAAPAADTTGEPAAEGDLGPGGRPLRTDYPGTPESKQANMETARLGGGARGDEQTYDLRVRELETRIDDLKDRVFRSKSRIVLLRETLLGGKLAGSAAIIRHTDELGSGFKLVRATYILNGKSIYNKFDEDKGLLPEDRQLEIFNGAMSPSSHFLDVTLVYKGDSSVLPYFKGYTFTLSDRCPFEVEQGLTTIVDVTPFEGGDATTSVEDRPRLKCKVTKTTIDAATKGVATEEAQ